MDPESFFKISYGLYVIGSAFNGKTNGYIANTVFQVTAEPAQIAIACSKNNYSAELIAQGRAFSISVLKKEASPLVIGTFGYKSGRDFDKFNGFNYFTGKLGTPILTSDSLAWFECRMVNTFDTGTHLIFIGQVDAYDMLDTQAEPLTYAWFREVKKGKAPKNAPTYVAPETDKKNPPVKTYYCAACGYTYNPAEGDPNAGIAPGTPFENLPKQWVCPNCGAEKEDFIVK